MRIHGAGPVMFDDAFGGPGALIARSTNSLAHLAHLPHQIRTGLRALGIALVALAGPETTGVPVIEDVDEVYTPDRLQARSIRAPQRRSDPTRTPPLWSPECCAWLARH